MSRLARWLIYAGYLYSRAVATLDRVGWVCGPLGPATDEVAQAGKSKALKDADGQRGVVTGTRVNDGVLDVFLGDASVVEDL